MIFLGRGGVGGVLSDFNRCSFDFCLKLVKCSRDPRQNKKFWEAAQAIQAWTADMRFHAQFAKIPLAQQYWIKASDCGEGEKRPGLSSLITFHGCLGQCQNCPEDLQDVDPDEYVLCPDELLKRIYHDARCGIFNQCSLLLTYPVQKGENSVAKCIDDNIAKGKTFSEKDLLNCCYQILSAIDYLYERGAAHRDIKPANILADKFSEKETVFRLIDFDAFHSPEHNSTAGTAGFLPDELLVAELQKRFPPLEFRVLLDCFALAQTISCMHAGCQVPPEEFSPAIPGVIKQLYTIGKFHPSQIKTLLAELEKYNCRSPEFVYTPTDYVWGSSYPFDSAGICELGEYGTFHEQLRFAAGPTVKFDPLLKTPCCRASLHTRFPFIHCPLGSDRRNTYFHAPDDAATGTRPQDMDFTCYIPKTLLNTCLSAEEKEKLFSYGRQLDAFLDSHKERSFFLPREGHILWCDGEIKILWGFGPRLRSAVCCEDYFRFLAGEKVRFSYQDWRTLLPLDSRLRKDTCQEYWQNILAETAAHSWTDYSWLYKIPEFREFVISKAGSLSVQERLRSMPHIPELEKELTVKVCRELLQEFSKDLRHAWLFDSEIFRKKIADETLLFSEKHWLEVRNHTHTFDHQISADTGFLMFKSGSAAQRKSLLNSSLRSALLSRIRKDPAERIKVFFLLEKYDEETFSELMPEEARKEFTSRQWGQFIALGPELVKFMPEKFFSFLSRKTWVRLLGAKPELFANCPCCKAFDSAQWCSILLQQPGLKKFLPSDIVFSDHEERRLRKKHF